jgi:hypothetical protein
MEQRWPVVWIAFAIGACVGDAPSAGGGGDSGVGGDSASAQDAGPGGTDSSQGDSGAIADTSVTDSAPQEASAGEASADAPFDAASWAPSRLPGLVCWLDAAKGVTGTTSVSAWADQSGDGNNAANGGTGQPSLVPSAVNGHPTVRFTGSAAGTNGQSLTIADAPSLQWGTGDFLVAAVVRESNSSGGNGVLWNKQALANPYAGPALWVGFGTSFGAEVNYANYFEGAAVTNDGNPHIALMQLVTGTLYLRIDGAQSGTPLTPAPAVDVSAAGKAVTLGANVSEAQALDGDIAEIVAVKGTTSPTDRSMLEAYLKAKYNTP